MSDELKQLLGDFLKVAGGGLVTWFVSNWRPRQVRADTHDEAQNKTIEVQGRTLADAWKMIEQQQEQQIKNMERIDWLENELRKYANAYAKAMRFIHENVKGVDIPDFLLESKPSIKKGNR